MIHKPIIYIPLIFRGDLRIAPAVFFVFGDNLTRKGYGGQAKEMRGEPNTIGIATKRLPSMDPEAFFSDDNPEDRIALMSDLMRVVGLWNSGHQIVAPLMGLGTERARLKEKAPGLFQLIVDTFRSMSDEKFPWQDVTTVTTP